MSTPSDKKHYKAFISYSTADEKWAKWLWYQLEYYQVPTKLRKEYPHLPKNLRPIFWYKQDLSGTHLQASLYKELDDSEFLIVLCSPSSAQSEWVNKEVQRFMELGRGHKIILLILAGMPHADNAAEECLPPALQALPKENELRGIDVRRKEGKNHALVDVIATMLGVRFNELWQRHLRRRKKIIRRIITTLCVLIPCIIMQVEYKRGHVEYYADYVDQWGVPVGVVPLTKEQVAHRHDSYRFTYYRTPLSHHDPLSLRLKQVAHVNSVDEVVEHTNLEFVRRSPIMEISYSQQTGLPTQIIYANAEEEIQFRHDLSTHNSVVAAIADFRSATEDMGSDFLHANSASMKKQEFESKSSIKRFAYVRDDNGYIAQITYHSNNDDDLANSAVCDGNGIYGARFFRDSIGRILRVEYIDNDGRITCTKKAVAGYQYTYGNMGSVDSFLYFDMDGNPVLNDQQWASSKELIDEYGNTYRGFFYDEKGQLCNCSEGYAQYKYEHDERGNKITKLHYDADTALCLNNEGIAVWTKRYDKYNQCIGTAYYGTDTRPCVSNKGFATESMKYNLMGQCTERCFYGLDGKPCICTRGYAKVVHQYDFRGNCVATSYYDAEGKPALYIGLCATVKREFDEQGNNIKETMFDQQGNPTYYDGSQVAIWKAKYNSSRMITEHSFYDINDKLCNSADGYAIQRMKYTVRGDVLEMAYYDAQQKPCTIKRGGYFKETFKYNERAQCTEIRYYGTDNQRCMYMDQYAICKLEYDSVGNMTKIAYYDTKEQLTEDSHGVAIYHYTYDQRGNLLIETHLNKNQKVIQ